jgi:hypothetical protein
LQTPADDARSNGKNEVADMIDKFKVRSGVEREREVRGGVYFVLIFPLPHVGPVLPVPAPSPLPSSISPVKATGPSPSPAMTPSPLTASPAPSPVPLPSHTPQTTSSMPPAQPHYPPGPSVQYGAHPAPQSQGAPYLAQQSGYYPGHSSAAQSVSSSLTSSSKANHFSGGLSDSSLLPPGQHIFLASAHPPSSVVMVKLVHGDNIRTQQLELQETIESFTKKMKELFGGEVIVKYMDEEGDPVIVGSTHDVQHVIKLAQKKTDGFYRLTVSAAATLSSSSHGVPSVGGVGFPSSLPPSSSPYVNGPLPSYPSHPPPSLPHHAAPLQSLTPPLPVEQRTFQTSYFKRFYAAAPVPEFQHVVFTDLMAIIKWDCERRNIDVKGEGTTFFQVFHFYAKRYFRISKPFCFILNVCLISSFSSHFHLFVPSTQQLQAEAFHNKDELLSEVPAACQRLWTSALQLRGREFCSILNEAIQVDDPTISPNVALIVRGINCLTVMREVEGLPVNWPIDFKLYRGGGLPYQHSFFFTVGKMYRVPMFLATSTDWALCQRTFCYRAEALSGQPPVLYVVQIHPQWRCVHVNYVTRTHCSGEREFLFVPYSVFEVANVQWKDHPTWESPHVVFLNAMSDNRRYPEDLPLAPWH